MNVFWIPLAAAVVVAGTWLIIQVIRDTFTPEQDVQDEIDEETVWLQAVQRATERRHP